MAGTNYARNTNEQIRQAEVCLAQAEQARIAATKTQLVAEAQVHATLAVAYAQLATYTATGG